MEVSIISVGDSDSDKTNILDRVNFVFYELTSDRPPFPDVLIAMLLHSKVVAGLRTYKSTHPVRVPSVSSPSPLLPATVLRHSVALLRCSKLCSPRYSTYDATWRRLQAPESRCSSSPRTRAGRRKTRGKWDQQGPGGPRHHRSRREKKNDVAFRQELPAKPNCTAI